MVKISVNGSQSPSASVISIENETALERILLYVDQFRMNRDLQDADLIRNEIEELNQQWVDSCLYEDDFDLFEEMEGFVESYDLRHKITFFYSLYTLFQHAPITEKGAFLKKLDSRIADLLQSPELGTLDPSLTRAYSFLSLLTSQVKGSPIPFSIPWAELARFVYINRTNPQSLEVYGQIFGKVECDLSRIQDPRSELLEHFNRGFEVSSDCLPLLIRALPLMQVSFREEIKTLLGLNPSPEILGRILDSLPYTASKLSQALSDHHENIRELFPALFLQTLVLNQDWDRSSLLSSYQIQCRLASNARTFEAAFMTLQKFENRLSSDPELLRDMRTCFAAMLIENLPQTEELAFRYFKGRGMENFLTEVSIEKALKNRSFVWRLFQVYAGINPRITGYVKEPLLRALYQEPTRPEAQIFLLFELAPSILDDWFRMVSCTKWGSSLSIPQEISTEEKILLLIDQWGLIDSLIEQNKEEWVLSFAACPNEQIRSAIQKFAWKLIQRDLNRANHFFRSLPPMAFWLREAVSGEYISQFLQNPRSDRVNQDALQWLVPVAASAEDRRAWYLYWERECPGSLTSIARSFPIKEKQQLRNMLYQKAMREKDSVLVFKTFREALEHSEITEEDIGWMKKFIKEFGEDESFCSLVIEQIGELCDQQFSTDVIYVLLYALHRANSSQNTSNQIWATLLRMAGLNRPLSLMDREEADAVLKFFFSRKYEGFPALILKMRNHPLLQRELCVLGRLVLRNSDLGERIGRLLEESVNEPNIFQQSLNDVCAEYINIENLSNMGIESFLNYHHELPERLVERLLIHALTKPALATYISNCLDRILQGRQLSEKLAESILLFLIRVRPYGLLERLLDAGIFSAAELWDTMKETYRPSEFDPLVHFAFHCFSKNEYVMILNFWSEKCENPISRPPLESLQKICDSKQFPEIWKKVFRSALQSAKKEKKKKIVQARKPEPEAASKKSLKGMKENFEKTLVLSGYKDKELFTLFQGILYSWNSNKEAIDPYWVYEHVMKYIENGLMGQSALVVMLVTAIPDENDRNRLLDAAIEFLINPQSTISLDKQQLSRDLEYLWVARTALLHALPITEFSEWVNRYNKIIKKMIPIDIYLTMGGLQKAIDMMLMAGFSKEDELPIVGAQIKKYHEVSLTFTSGSLIRLRKGLSPIKYLKMSIHNQQSRNILKCVCPLMQEF